MSHFIVFFSPQQENSLARQRLYGIKDELLSKGIINHGEIFEQPHTLILTTTFGTTSPQFILTEEGWVVLSGTAIHTRLPDPRLSHETFLRELSTNPEQAFHDVEGCFALAAWNGKKGWLLNDALIQRNYYYSEADGGLYGSTLSLPLARALKKPLDVRAAASMLTRGCINSPLSMFEGISRVDVGEHVEYLDGKIKTVRHWIPYREPENYANKDEAASDCLSLLVDRVRRLGQIGSPIVTDLTAGYDTRLIACSMDFARLDFGVTVNGADDNVDVVLGKRVAQTMGWDMLHVNEEGFLPDTVSPELRTQLLYYVNGERVFSSILLRTQSRPQLAKLYPLKFGGNGGDVLRYYPWGHELWRIGRRETANADRNLNYRFFQKVVVKPSDFDFNWLPHFRSYLRSMVMQYSTMVPNTRNTQQLDAIHVWKNAGGHSAPNLSALAHIMPTMNPMQMRSVTEGGMALPWTYRISADLMRRMIYMASPKAANVLTQYGNSAAPVSLRTFPREFVQVYRQGRHIVRKIYKVKTHKHSNPKFAYRSDLFETCLTPEFRSLMVPESMYSKALYNKEFLTSVFAGNTSDWKSREELILRISSLELLCRELDYQPDGSFWFGLKEFAQ